MKLIMRAMTVEEMGVIEGGFNWKCIAGTVGSGLLGALTGGAAGSAIPGVGTGAGFLIGGIAGGLVGAATFC